MEVCLVTPKFNVREAYGGEVSVKLLADELVRRGVGVRIVASEVEGDAPNVTRAPLTSGAIAKAAAGASVVHAYNMDAIGAAVAGARMARVAAVASANSYWATCLWGDMCWPDGEVCERCTTSGLRRCYATRNPLTIGRRVPALLGRAEVMRRTALLARFDRIVVLSEASRRQLTGAGVPAERLEVIPNMADPTLPGHDAPLPPLAREPLILSVGALKHTKGHHVLVDAMPRVLERVPAARALIVGSGPEEEPLRARIAALGLQERVALAGRLAQPALAAKYREARVVAFPVLWEEPFGRVTLEAWAHGAPLVVSERGGPGEVVRDGESGLVARANDPAALAGALARALTDDALAERLRAGGRRALAAFAPDVVLPRLLALYERLAAEGAR